MGQGWQRRQWMDILPAHGFKRVISTIYNKVHGRQHAPAHNVYYSGHVQGVGFRYTTQSIARGHEVTGYVRNLPDGRVELVAEGRPGEIEAFLTEVRDRLINHIREESTDKGPATGEFDRFEVRH